MPLGRGLLTAAPLRCMLCLELRCLVLFLRLACACYSVVSCLIQRIEMEFALDINTRVKRKQVGIERIPYPLRLRFLQVVVGVSDSAGPSTTQRSRVRNNPRIQISGNWADPTRGMRAWQTVVQHTRSLQKAGCSGLGAMG